MERLFGVVVEEEPQVRRSFLLWVSSLFLLSLCLTKKNSNSKTPKKTHQGTAPTWNKDVRFLKVSSKSTGKPIAFMFLDPYSRPDQKRGGAWMDEVVGRSVACASSSSDEKVRLPVAHMVLNSTPPVGDKPSLMTFREVSGRERFLFD